MDEQSKSELVSIKELIMDLMDRITGLELRDDAAADDPGVVPNETEPWVVTSTDDDVPDLEGGIFEDLIDELLLVPELALRLDRVLVENGNIIRPSVALRAISELIKECLSYDVEAFANHPTAWNEVRRILEASAVEVAGAKIDSEYAWQLGDIDVKLDDALPFIATQISRFQGMYDAALRNSRNSSFGALTPGECLSMLAYLMRRLTPAAGDHPNIFSMRHPSVAKWYAPMPWADWTWKALKLLAEQHLEPVGAPANPMPAEPPPYSVPWGS